MPGTGGALVDRTTIRARASVIGVTLAICLQDLVQRQQFGVFLPRREGPPGAAVGDDDLMGLAFDRVVENEAARVMVGGKPVRPRRADNGRGRSRHLGIGVDTDGGAKGRGGRGARIGGRVDAV